jgi:predicted GNAT family acetyltransferase
VCASVRIGPAAYEAGVQTLPAYRRKGHARSTVGAWIRAVRALGATPLYSTSSDNAASQAVAVSLGMARFGVDFHVG